MVNKLRKDKEKLEKYYQEVSKIILVRQHAASGLIPASVAITAHGDYRDAWVRYQILTRDNVYSILAVWGLALAYRRLDDDQGRAYELEHATIKCMRGLLFAMMRQAHKVETFKGTQALDQALHAKYNTTNGDTVVGDNQWGHLQIDATSIFLLLLAQMTASGLHIIYTLDEVQFVQNLVFYIERAYRTPDYGIWERGNKINHGQPELNCSSIGMVVAALEAINGINLFGSRGGASSVIHVLPDEIARNFTTLHSALPRESPSKEIDAALLSVISYPAFAVTDPEVIERTRKDIVKKLGGRYGCKRFLRDGHQTVLEDHNRLHYEPHELKIFENVESEWPLFFTYLILDGLFRNDNKQVEHYTNLLDPILIDAETITQYQTDESDYEEPAQFQIRLVPELYIVPKESIEAERQHPGSQDRVPNQNVPLVWAQSLYILGNLIRDGLLSVADIDPLGRRLNPVRSRLHIDTVVQIVLISESDELQSKLLMYGLETHTIQDVAPITVSKPSCLRDAYTFLGKNSKLGLSGRPDRPIGTLSTCKIYRCQGQLYAFLPHFMDREEFYLVSDNDYLVSLFEQEISSVRNHWMQTGRPTMVVMLNKQMLGNIDRVDSEKGTFDSGKRNLLNFLISIKSSGICHGTRVRVGRLSEMINTACVESLDFLVNHGSESSEDWDGILKGKQQKKSGAEKLKFSETTYFDQNKVVPTRNCTVRTEQDLPLKSPLAKSLGYTPDMEELDLLEDMKLEDSHEEDEFGNVKKSNSPIHEDSPVSLTLGHPAQTSQAIELLYKSHSLSDQIDLLHYLYSCHGLDYVVPKLASINVLIEEVYWKAMHVKQWSAVRKAAGILKKTVNSLTSNLADLLVRQKPVTIGIRPKEFFIDTPKNPAALAQIIFDNCTSDIREAPLIQEIITYLGSLIRSSPAVFSGIMRIRTHFFVIAMREEISRALRCDEEEAIEHLMSLSPYEMKTLLQQVLVAHDQVETFKIGSSKPEPKHRGFQLGETGKSSKVHLHGHELTIAVQSGGYSAGSFADIEILNDNVIVPVSLIPGRGINTITIDPYDGRLLQCSNFDTHFSVSESDQFAKHINSLEMGTVVIIAIKDDFVECMTEAAYVAIESLGATNIRKAQYRDSYCLIGEKGAKSGSVPESHRPAHLGPTERISKVFDLSANRPADPRKGSVMTTILPSNGWWLRRRRNDGALNRVPPGFYPKVWRLLSKTSGIKVGGAILLSHPTISESTPEELNFALQVENLLDNIIDPAEHQIAVECLVVISKIEDRNPELTLSSEGFDLKVLINESIKAFWDKWIAEKANQNILTTLICRTDVVKKAIDSALSPIGEGPFSPPIRPGGTHMVELSAVQNASKRIGNTGAPPSKLHDRLETPTTSQIPGTDLSYEKNDRLARRIFFDLRQDGVNGTMSYLAAACVRHAFGVSWTSEQNASISFRE